MGEGVAIGERNSDSQEKQKTGTGQKAKERGTTGRRKYVERNRSEMLNYAGKRRRMEKYCLRERRKKTRESRPEVRKTKEKIYQSKPEVGTIPVTLPSVGAHTWK